MPGSGVPYQLQPPLEWNTGIYIGATKGLTHISPSILDAGINGRFPEADDNAIYTLQGDPKAFRFFVQWLYNAKTEVVQGYKSHKDLYKGNKLGCFAFRDSLMRELIPQHWIDILSVETFSTAYQRCPPESMTGKWVVEGIPLQLLNQVPGR